MQLSIVIPTLNERENIIRLIPLLREAIPPDVTAYEIIVVDGYSQDGSAQAAVQLGARVLLQSRPGYGGALQEGFRYAQGAYVITLDADLSHSPDFIAALWHAREQGELIIASRYVPGGTAAMPAMRRILSGILNVVFSRAVSLPVRDASSGFRLYKTALLQEMRLESLHFDVLEEILIRALGAGWRIVEVPFHYQPRASGRSHAKLLKFGWAYLKTLLRMWRLRNSVDSADYDYRAYDSVIPLQRYWQRTRHRIIVEFARGAGRTLDVGCGSSRILLDLDNAIGLDVQMNKIRYMRQHQARGLVGSLMALPIADESVDCLICSEVIEHLPAEPILFQEMARVLKPRGRLIIGTPNYGNMIWPTFEFFYGLFAPGGYADEHITHYTRASLEDTLAQHGFEPRQVRWVGRAEMIICCVKKETLGGEVGLTSP